MWSLNFFLSLTTIVSVLAIILAIVWVSFAQQPDDKTKNQEKQTQQSATKQNLQHGCHFVDKDGDGYNDNAPDHDGDGIPNGVDPDYQGAKKRFGGKMRGFVDANGDGINDLTGSRMGSMRKGRGAGLGNVICDGTGPKGSGRNRGNR